MIQMTDLIKGFGDTEVLRGVTLHVPRGGITVIIGGSGHGKSVLVKHMIGLLRPDAGSIVVDGDEITKIPERDMLRVRRKFGMLFQSAALFDSMNVYENVSFALNEHTRLPEAEIRERVHAKLALLGLHGLDEKSPSELSGGMKKRVGLARAIVLDPSIIIYDEPTTGLDPIMSENVDQMIVDAQEKLSVTSVVISHDMPSTFRIATHIAMIHEGRIIQEGSPDEFRRTDNPIVKRFVELGLSA